jgi:uncharacterized LabA/DUF88 family protein
MAKKTSKAKKSNMAKTPSVVKIPSAGLYKEQRVGVFVDVQNLYYSAKFIHKAKVNFKTLLREAIKGRNLIRAIAYVIKADVKDETNFFDALKNFGYEVKAKDLQIFYGGAKKGDWDIGMNHVTHALGCYVEVMAFGKSCSQMLVEVADNFIDMDQDKSTYLIQSGKS